MIPPRLAHHLLLIILMTIGGCTGHQTHQRTIEELELVTQNSSKEIERLQKLVQEAEAEQLIKEQELGTLKQDRQALTSDIIALQETVDGGTQSDHLKLATSESEPPSYETLSDTLTQLREEIKKLKLESDEIRKAKDAESTQLAQIQQERQSVEQQLTQVAQTFQQEMGKDLRLRQEDHRLTLTILGRVLFRSGEADLTPMGLDIMSQIGNVLSNLPDKEIHVEGHADSQRIKGKLQGKYPTNWELSTARATTVLRYLIEKTSIPPDHFVAAGYADTRPIDSTQTVDGFSRNRRVEIVLYPRAPSSSTTLP